MPDQTARFITPPWPLGARVCAGDDGLTFEEVLTKADAIVTRTAAQWRLEALMDVDRLADIADRIWQDPPELGPALADFFTTARAIEDQASAHGLSGARSAAAALCCYLSGLDAEGGNLGDPCRHLSVIEQSMSVLQNELAAGASDQTPATSQNLAAD